MKRSRRPGTRCCGFFAVIVALADAVPMLVPESVLVPMLESVPWPVLVPVLESVRGPGCFCLGQACKSAAFFRASWPVS